MISPRQQPIDVTFIAALLDQRAADLAAYLLPNGRRSACRRWWETNSLADNPRPEGGYSLKLELGGPKRGKWRDHATAEAGDMLELATVRLFGGDKGEAIKWARSELQLDSLDPARVERIRYQAAETQRTSDEAAAREREARLRGARALWLSGVPIAGTAAERYLLARGIKAPIGPGGAAGWPGSLHFHEEVWNRDAGVKLPAMLATMVSPDGAQLGCHRTWLARDPRTRLWGKADGGDVGVPRGEAKKVLGPCAGAFVPIAKGASGRSMGQLREAEAVFVTEGIEDALCVAMVRPEVRVVAGYSLGNIGRIAFPALIDRVVIVADRDVKPAAVDALERAIAKQQAQGKRVQLVMPPVGCKDVNDWLRRDAEPGRAERAA